jgi:hypothetical protein
MKKLLCMWIITASFCEPLLAQKEVQKTVVYARGEVIEMDFEKVQKITVKVWDQQQVQVKAFASINNGENDEAFQLQSEQVAGKVKLVSTIKDWETLPRKHYTNEFGEFHTVVLDISIEVMVPRNADSISLTTREGAIDISGYEGSINAKSKNGSITIKLSEERVSVLLLQTKHGEIYTDFELQKAQAASMGNAQPKMNVVSFRYERKGATIALDTKNGNIYLRKI